MARLSRVLLLDRHKPASDTPPNAAVTVANLKRVLGQAARGASHSARGPCASPAAVKNLLDAMFHLATVIPDDLATRLAEFLSTPHNLRLLLTTMVSAPPAARADERMPLPAREANPHAWTVCVFLTNGPAKLRETIATNHDLIAILVGYLQASQRNTLTTDMAARVLSAVLSEKPAQATRVLADAPALVKSLVERVECPAVAVLLAQMVSEQDFGRANALDFGMAHKRTLVELAHADVLRLLVDRLAAAVATPASQLRLEDVSVMEGAMRALVQLSMRASMLQKREELHDLDVEVYYGIAPSLYNRSVDALSVVKRPAILLVAVDAALAAFEADKAHPALSIVSDNLAQLFRTLRQGRATRDLVIAQRARAVSTNAVGEALRMRVATLITVLEGANPSASARTRLAVGDFLVEMLYFSEELIAEATRQSLHKAVVELVQNHPSSTVFAQLAREMFRAVLKSSQLKYKTQWIQETDLVDVLMTSRSSPSPGVWQDLGQVVFLGAAEDATLLELLIHQMQAFTEAASGDFGSTTQTLLGGGKRPRVFNNRVSSDVYVGEDMGEHLYIKMALADCRSKSTKEHIRESYPVLEGILPSKKGPTHGKNRARRSLPEDFRDNT